MRKAVAAFFAAERPDVVFLAAAKVGGILANDTYPADFIRDNLAIQTNVIHEAWRAGVKRLLFLGSSCIYPRDCPQPIREDYLLTGPLEPTNRPYAIAKIAGIEMCWSYNRQYGTQYLCAMPTNLYGPGDNYDLQTSHVLPALIRRFHEAKERGDKTVTLWGTGAPRREFLYSDDMAAACVHLMTLPRGSTGDDRQRPTSRRSSTSAAVRTCRSASSPSSSGRSSAPMWRSNGIDQAGRHAAKAARRRQVVGAGVAAGDRTGRWDPARLCRFPGAARTLHGLMTTLTHLQRLEAESIHIMREVVAELANPVMLYSIGKDSSVMLHLARKAFYPAPPPFPLLHVDTTWKFREMYTMRTRMARETGMELIVHANPEAREMGINPFTHGSAVHTDVWKTQGLLQALAKHGFDAAFGGARRDEEKSRAKERIFSFRSAQHRWDPKNQRPELWRLYNTRIRPGESIRVFPISNWTELDVWQYIHLEKIPIVSLYLSAVRPVVARDGTLIMVDDERMPLRPGEVPLMKKVRFRTLGCYPLTGAIESEADTLVGVIQEMLLAATSERQGRVIDHDSAGSMEKKKQEGYF